MSKIIKVSKIALGIVTLSSVILLAGCGYTKEEKALMKNYESTAKTNSVKYIEDKYGITPRITGTKVIKADMGPVPSFTPPPTGMVDVYMTYNGTEFYVNISGEDENTDGSDTYQKEEIFEAFRLWFEKKLGIEIESVDLMYGQDCLLSEKFSDVDSFLEDMAGNTAVCAQAKTFDDLTEDTIKNIDTDAMYLLILSCKDQESMDILSEADYLNEHSYRMNFYNMEYLENKLAEYSLFLKSHLFRGNDGKISYATYESTMVEERMYFVYDGKSGSSGASIKRTSKMAPASDWDKNSGKVKSLPTFNSPVKLSESYEIDFGNLPGVQVFMKEEERDKKDKVQRGIALQYIDESGHEVFTHIYPVHCGGYYSFSLLRAEDMKFAVMKSSK